MNRFQQIVINNNQWALVNLTKKQPTYYKFSKDHLHIISSQRTMNIWLKSENIRKRNKKKSSSLSSSVSSFKSPLPIITESERLEQLLSKSLSSGISVSNDEIINVQKYQTRMQSEGEQKGMSSSLRPLRISNSSSQSLFGQRQSSLSNQNNKRKSFNSSLNININTNNSRRLLTTGRKNDLREHVISIIQYCSNQVGMAVYNISTGQILLAQIIERMTYMSTISTTERYYPQQIIFSNTLQNTPLIKKLMEHFKKTSFRPIRRNLFNETKGYYIYAQRGNKDQHNPDNKFLAYAALNALVSFLENNFEVELQYSALNIKWHFLEELLIIHSQTIADLEIFINFETKESKCVFADNFVCLTDGGMRMLRANLLQPSTNVKLITARLDFTEVLLSNKSFSDILAHQIIKFRHYEPITAKFIQAPKKSNPKSIKTYLNSILSLSKQCFELNTLKSKLQNFKQLSTITKSLYQKLQHPKLSLIRSLIEQNFDIEVLKSFEGNKIKNKKQSFIFLFKVEKIGDDFAEISRLTYSHTIEDILKIFEEIKGRTKENLKLLHNDYRGYYISAKAGVDLAQLGEEIEDDILHINTKGSSVTFSTSILISLNNRLKENENKLILQSEDLLHSIIAQIQKNLSILFEINYWISMTDMIMSFSHFIKTYRSNCGVEFSKPIFKESSQKIVIQKLRAIWTMEKFHRISQDFTLELHEDIKSLVISKEVNSFEQVNVLCSLGFLIILSQIGCMVPARKYQSTLYDTLVSKMKVGGDLENKMSHFQMQLSSLKAIIESAKYQRNKCMILVDQILRGTQPEEEWALSLAAVEQIVKCEGKSFILVSDLRLFGLLGEIDRVRTFKYENEGSAEKQEQLLGHFEKYNFCPEFVSQYKRIGNDL